MVVSGAVWSVGLIRFSSTDVNGIEGPVLIGAVGPRGAVGLPGLKSVSNFGVRFPELFWPPCEFSDWLLPCDCDWDEEPPTPRASAAFCCAFDEACVSTCAGTLLVPPVEGLIPTFVPEVSGCPFTWTCPARPDSTATTDPPLKATVTVLVSLPEIAVFAPVMLMTSTAMGIGFCGAGEMMTLAILFISLPKLTLR